jgi:hypothetical protein
MTDGGDLSSKSDLFNKAGRICTQSFPGNVSPEGSTTAKIDGSVYHAEILFLNRAGFWDRATFVLPGIHEPGRTITAVRPKTEGVYAFDFG